MSEQKNRLPRYHVPQILRFNQGESAICRCLTEDWDRTVAGMLTHYLSDRSRYCRGEDCPASLHRIDPIWKGYLAVEVWSKPLKLWVPWILEVSESMELCMRGKYERGQVWECGRINSKAAKRSQCWASLLEVLEPWQFSPPFDIRSYLTRVFHCPDLLLNVKNPMPSLPGLPCSTDAGPVEAPPAPPQTNAFADPEVRKQFDELMQRSGNGKMKDS